MLIIGLSFSFVVTSFEFYFKAKRRRVLDGVIEQCDRTLSFSTIRFRCLEIHDDQRPTFVKEKDVHDKCDMNDEIFEDINMKSNSLQTCPPEKSPSIDRDRLTIVPMNHLSARSRFSSK
jgi:hypothetical protein